MARLIFVNRFYWPEEPATAQLLTDLTAALAAGGAHQVQVITRRAPGSPRREARQGVEIHRVRTTNWGKANLAGRAIDFLTFICGVAWQLLRRCGPDTTVVVMTDPPGLDLTATTFAGLRGARIVHWIQDVFPEVVLAVGISGVARPVLSLWQCLRNRAWRRSAGCVVLSTDMAAHVAGRGVPVGRVHTIPNWAPAGLAPVPAAERAARRAAWEIPDQTFVVMYSGNLGRVHELACVLDLAEAVRGEPVLFLLVGSGAQHAILQDGARRRRLDNIRFLPAQPREQLAASLAVGDIHLVTLRKDCKDLVFPSKFYGIVAIERPIVFIGPTDSAMARAIGTQNLGAAFEIDQIPAAAEFLKALQSDPQRLTGMQRAVAAIREDVGLPMAASRWRSYLSRI